MIGAKYLAISGFVLACLMIIWLLILIPFFQ